jgi:ABC-type transporter Mla maintaining outer membrane lipid asymmetry ATPase subunit MlaF
VIKVEDLYKSFGRQPVLRGVDLEVPTGSITIIIGRSGGVPQAPPRPAPA